MREWKSILVLSPGDKITSWKWFPLFSALSQGLPTVLHVKHQPDPSSPDLRLAPELAPTVGPGLEVAEVRGVGRGGVGLALAGAEAGVGGGAGGARRALGAGRAGAVDLDYLINYLLIIY